MKKVVLIMLAIFCVFSCICFAGCKRENDGDKAPDVSESPRENESLDPADYKAPDVDEDPVTFLYANGWDPQNPQTSRGLSCKILKGSAAKAIRNILVGLQPTGEIVPAFSDTFEMPDYDVVCDMPAPAATRWIEVDDMIYRISQGQICAVNRHFGAGLLLGGDDKAADRIFAIYSKRQGYYLEGDYIEGVLTIENTAEELDTTVKLEVKEVYASQKKGEDAKVILELTSLTDQTIRLRWKTFLSEDNILGFDGEQFTFQAGETRELELNYTQGKNQYWFEVRVNNTPMVRIYFHPPKTE